MAALFARLWLSRSVTDPVGLTVAKPFRTMLLCLSRGSDGVLVATVLGLSGGVLTGLLLGYGQDRDGRP